MSQYQKPSEAIKQLPVARVFKYIKPDEAKFSGKHLTVLARTDRMLGMVQVIKSGGENNLHSHKHLDGFWMVLKGGAIFYGEDDVVVAKLGPMEGVLIPRHFKYWFESVPGETLELLQIEAFDVSLGDDRTLFAEREDHTPKKAETMRTMTMSDGRVDSPNFAKVRPFALD